MNIYLIKWITSVIIIIQDILGIWTAWLIPHLIVNSSVSINIILTAWWIVLATVLWHDQTCNIDIAILLLILASEITIIVLEFDRMSLAILLSLQRSVSLFHLSLQFTVWKEKWLGKLSTSLKLEESFCKGDRKIERFY